MYTVQTIIGRTVKEKSFANFADVLTYAAGKGAKVWNAYECDYATDTGFHDGLTADERDALEAL